MQRQIARPGSSEENVQQASEAVLDAYLGEGGNFIDTADVYLRWVPGNSGGDSEAVASGFLSGKYRAGKDLPAKARASGVQKNYMNDRGFAVLAAVEKVASKVGATPAQVALSWMVHRPGITAPIASATSVAQLKEILGAVELKLDDEATAALDKASAWKDAS